MKYLIKLIISSLIYSCLLIYACDDISNSFNAEKKFLKKQLKKNPDNLLYAFDLAQIFQSLSKYDKAIKLYHQSRLLGNEEGWYSEYMIGKCYDLKDEWDNAVKYYHSSFEQRPTRAEPLFDIAQHYYKIGKHSSVCFYADKGIKISYPKNDIIGIDGDIYKFKFLELLSVSSYYEKNYKHKALEYIDQLLFHPYVPQYVKDNALKNLLFYVENINNIKLIPIKAKMPPLSDWSLERYRPCNPSIVKTNKGYIVNCRAVNYVQWTPAYVVMDGTKVSKSKNVYIEYDKNLGKCFESIIEESPWLIQYNTMSKGLEDLRLFYYNDELYFTATSCELNKLGIPKMCLGTFEIKNDHEKQKLISVNEITLLEGPAVERAEKNWMPLVIENDLYLIYSFKPYIIYKHNFQTKKSKQFITKDPLCDFSRFAGSAPPIKFDEGYLVMVHEGIWLDRKYYIHRFVYLDKNLDVKKISKPFTFKHTGVEMCCGMVIDHNENKLIMSIALEDREAYLALLDLVQIRSLLKDLKN